jgi:hypothetical protein
MDKSKFAYYCKEAIIQKHQRYNIGTYFEKRMHTVLKNYICSDQNYHEVVVSDTELDRKKTSNYIADILIEDKIFEIQTGSFYPLSTKIKYYMQNTDFYVEIVYPVIVDNKIFWINNDGGEIMKSRKSPIHNSYEQLIAQMYFLLPYINNKKLSFRVLLLSANEYRTYDVDKNNKKKNSTRYEIIPVELYDEKVFNSKEDFYDILPDNLSDIFVASEFGKAIKLRGRAIYGALKVFCELGIIEKLGKNGRSFEYRKM